MKNGEHETPSEPNASGPPREDESHEVGQQIACAVNQYDEMVSTARDNGDNQILDFLVSSKEQFAGPQTDTTQEEKPREKTESERQVELIALEILKEIVEKIKTTKFDSAEVVVSHTKEHPDQRDPLRVDAWRLLRERYLQPKSQLNFGKVGGQLHLSSQIDSPFTGWGIREDLNFSLEGPDKGELISIIYFLSKA